MVSRCRACDAPIVWADRAEEGAGRIALDAHEQFGGNFRLEHGVAVEVPEDDVRHSFREHNCDVRRAVAG